VKPLKCGPDYVKIFGNPNPYYDPNSNWCKNSNLWFMGSTDWVCGGDKYGVNLPFRYNDYGDVECFSVNGKDCAWEKGTGKDCQDYIKDNQKNINPVKCGTMLLAVHGSDGYSDPKHWCRILMDKFVLTSRKN